MQEFSCQNHVRAVLRMQDRLFVCTTGSGSPAVYYLDVLSSDLIVVVVVVVVVVIEIYILLYGISLVIAVVVVVVVVSSRIRQPARYCYWSLMFVMMFVTFVCKFVVIFIN